MNRVANKVAIVTGAAKGIGLASAQRLAREGARVLLTDIDSAAGEQQAQQLVAEGRSAAFMKHDTRCASDWTHVIERALAQWDRFDILVNNAGIAPLGNVEQVSMEDWRRTLEVNLDGVFIGTQQAIAAMKKHGGGAIVNVASIEGLIGEPMVAAYNASKGGVRIFTKSAAVHCARAGYNIRINTVCPGFAETTMVTGGMQDMPAQAAQQFQQALFQRIPMGRLARPEEIASAILFLASDESSFMTGADLVIDGGHTAQ
ncbi:MAG: glucose 1-dehydrogenase [Pseudomonadota bacterium]